jgi:ABC-type multidrug transport system ATPase subunit
MLKVLNLTKIYNQKSIHGIRNISFTISKNTITCLAGPSGSGKTTLMKILSSELNQDSGNFEFESPFRLATLIKNNLIKEDISVFEFIESGIKDFITEKETRINQVRLTLADLEMTNEIHKKMSQLSAGQKQRAILGHALVQNPNVLFLDEPFAHLDLDLRFELMNFLQNIVKTKEMTLLWITHNLNEALPFCDNIMLIDHGELKAFGKKEEIYNSPPNFFSAQFLGNRNVLVAKKTSEDKFNLLGVDYPAPKLTLQEDFLILIPMDEILIDTEGLEAQVINQLYYGSYYLIEVLAQGQILYLKNKSYIQSKKIFLQFNLACFKFIPQI